MEFLHDFFFLAKFTAKHLCRSLFLTKLHFSILQLHWNKGLPHRCFLVNFPRYLRQRFYRTPPSDRKVFYQQNRKELFEKRIKMETACMKNSDTRWTNVITIYIMSSYPFTIQKCLYVSFLYCPWYIENTSFRNKGVPLRI